MLLVVLKRCSEATRAKLAATFGDDYMETTINVAPACKFISPFKEHVLSELPQNQLDYMIGPVVPIEDLLADHSAFFTFRSPRRPSSQYSARHQNQMAMLVGPQALSE